MPNPRLARALASLPVTEDRPCSYLPDRQARQQQFFWPAGEAPMPSELYQDLMDAGFRRSGRLLYRPRCPGCSSCVPIRIPVDGFRLRASHRRVLRKNQDVTVRWTAPSLDDARLALYTRYVRARHDPGSEPDFLSSAGVRREQLRAFLYDSPLESIEGAYYVADRLVAVGICDCTETALSTVYFFFDPDEAWRSLGVYSALQEIAYARARGLGHYYLGYWVPGCRKMEYKAAFGDHELLGQHGWVPAIRSSGV